MAVLDSCCCCRYSIRKGSFISASYTVTFFLVFAFLTGNMTYLEISGWIQQTYQQKNASRGGEEKLNASNNFVMPQSSQNSYKRHSSDGGVDDTIYPYSQSLPFSIFMLVIDFSCEVAGFFASIVLIKGLRQDRKSLLIPWMIIVPLHTAIDLYSALDILITFATRLVPVGQPHGSDPHRDYVSQLLFGTGFGTLTSIINIYVLLCVFSQYQEYCAGRGTAAFETLVEQSKAACEHRERLNAASNGNRGNQKSDIWCDDAILSITNRSSKENHSADIPLTNIPNPGCSNGSLNGKLPTVRFENKSSTSSVEVNKDERRQRLNNMISKNQILDKQSTGNHKNLTVPPNCTRSGCSTPTVQEESLTADTIDES